MVETTLTSLTNAVCKFTKLNFHQGFKKLSIFCVPSAVKFGHAVLRYIYEWTDSQTYIHAHSKFATLFTPPGVK